MSSNEDQKPPAWTDAEKATEEKGYPHPGSFIQLPNGGGTIHLQYGHPQDVGRNGCFMTDVVEGIIQNMQVYQQPGNRMASPETEEFLDHMKAAKQALLNRRGDRKQRGVLNTDKE